MLSLSSNIITVHCLKVSFPMKSTAWLQKENSLRIRGSNSVGRAQPQKYKDVWKPPHKPENLHCQHEADAMGLSTYPALVYTSDEHPMPI